MFEKEPTQLSEEQHKASNNIQAELIKRYAEEKSMGGNEAAFEWIQRYSPTFRQLIEVDPELLDAWKEDPENTLALFEEKLSEDSAAEAA